MHLNCYICIRGVRLESETRIHARYKGEKGVQTRRRDEKAQKKRKKSEAVIDQDGSRRSLDAKTPFFRCLSSPLDAFSFAPDQIGLLLLFGFLGFSGLWCRFFPFLTCPFASPRIFRVSTLPLVSLFWSSSSFIPLLSTPLPPSTFYILPFQLYWLLLNTCFPLGAATKQLAAWSCCEG